MPEESSAWRNRTGPDRLTGIREIDRAAGTVTVGNRGAGRPTAPHEAYFTAVEQMTTAHGGRPHWGKLHSRDAGYLARADTHLRRPRGLTVRTVLPRFPTSPSRLRLKGA